MNIAYYNGIFVSYEKIINLIENLKNQKGIFTTILVEEGQIYFLNKHLHRLNDQLNKLGIFNETNLRSVIFQLIVKNQAQTGNWRLKIIALYNSTFVLLQREKTILKNYNLAVYYSFSNSKLARLKTLANFKRLGLLNFFRQKDFDDCIIFDARKNVLETLVANIFWIKDSIFYYPCKKLFYLHGITLSFAIKVAKKLNMQIKYGAFKLDDLQDSIVFYCNSMKKIVAVEEIEGIKIKKNTSTHAEFIHSFYLMAKDYLFDYSSLQIQ